ncbi:Plasminogen [Lamellibrachia satsuma]|nr:Plasminogen [Lamellibrachia satsuma]
MRRTGLLLLLLAVFLCFSEADGSSPVEHSLIEAQENIRHVVKRRSHKYDKYTKEACIRGITLGEKKIKIESPGWSSREDYPNDSQCVWIIKAPAGKAVKVKVYHLDIDCSDSVKIYNFHNNQKGAELTSVCGSRRVIVTSRTNSVYIVFKSDASKTGSGFKIRYYWKTANVPAPPTCGTSHIRPNTLGLAARKSGARIIGGIGVTPHSWPWMVSLRTQGTINHCGATLLHPRWVVLAAHCVKQQWSLSQLKLVFGKHNTSASEAGEKTIAVKTRIIHENYNSATENFDIALLELKEAVVYTSHIQPVCLPKDDVVDGTFCIATGWGTTVPNMYKDPEILHQVVLPIISRSVCQRPDWLGSRITENMLCAGYTQGGKDACQVNSSIGRDVVRGPYVERGKLGY